MSGRKIENRIDKFWNPSSHSKSGRPESEPGQPEGTNWELSQGATMTTEKRVDRWSNGIALALVLGLIGGVLAGVNWGILWLIGHDPLCPFAWGWWTICILFVLVAITRAARS